MVRMFIFVFIDTPTSDIYTLSLHDALPISAHSAGHDRKKPGPWDPRPPGAWWDPDAPGGLRSEEHTSELQSLRQLVCRHLLEKKKNAGVTNMLVDTFLRP